MNSAILLKDGHPEGPIVFCVPGAGDTVTAFLPLVELLEHDITVYGLQGNFTLTSAARTGSSIVEPVAAAFVDIVRRIPRTSPCCLIGHSFGGWIAFEMALKLTDLCQPIAAVVILDSDPPGQPDATNYDRVDTLLAIGEVLEMASGKPLALTRTALEAKAEHEQFEWLAREMKRIGLLPRTARLSLIEDLVRLFEIGLNAQYSPARSLSAEAWLVQPREVWRSRNGECIINSEYTSEEALLLWSAYASNLKCISVSGNHISMLHHPNITSTARLLQGFWREKC